MTAPFCSLFVIFGLALAVPQLAADPLFETTATMNVRIEAPLADVQRERDSGDYHAGLFHYVDDTGAEQTLDIKLRARGRYRREARTCRFPPIRLNFRKGQVKDTAFEGQDKLKLVTHCRTGSARYEQLLLRELLAYRFMQALTDNSFRTRLLRVTWHDGVSTEEPFEHYAFLIEDEDRLGKRLGHAPVKQQQLAVRQLEPEQAGLVSVFQYMIGNTDFSLLAGPASENCCHNAVPFQRGEHVLAVPYDFDFSGVVDAPYATPNPRLKTTSVETRVYRGRCEHNDVLPATLQLFRDQRDEIIALIDNQEGLNNQSRKRIHAYMEKFARIIDDDRAVQRHLVRECVR